jgi:hypothetical protein
MAKYKGKKEFLSDVSNKIQGLVNQPEEILWPNIEVYLLSLVNPVKKLEHLSEDVVILVNSFIELTNT